VINNSIFRHIFTRNNIKKLEDSQNSEDTDRNMENGNTSKNLKLKRQYKKLEEAFRDLSLDLY